MSELDRQDAILDLINEGALPDGYEPGKPLPSTRTIPSFVLRKGNEFIGQFNDISIVELADTVQPGSYVMWVPDEMGVAFPISLRRKEPGNSPAPEATTSLIEHKVKAEFLTRENDDLRRRLEIASNELVTLRQKAAETNTNSDFIKMLSEFKKLEAEATGRVAGHRLLTDSLSEGLKIGQESALNTIKLLETQLDEKRKEIEELKAKNDELEDLLDEYKSKVGELPKEGIDWNELAGTALDMFRSVVTNGQAKPAQLPAELPVAESEVNIQAMQKTTEDAMGLIQELVTKWIQKTIFKNDGLDNDGLINSLLSGFNSHPMGEFIKVMIAQTEPKDVAAYVLNEITKKGLGLTDDQMKKVNKNLLEVLDVLQERLSD